MSQHSQKSSKEEKNQDAIPRKRTVVVLEGIKEHAATAVAIVTILGIVFSAGYWIKDVEFKSQTTSTAQAETIKNLKADVNILRKRGDSLYQQLVIKTNKVKELEARLYSRTAITS